MGSLIVFIALGVIFYYVFKSTVRFQKNEGSNYRRQSSAYNQRKAKSSSWGDRSSWSQDGALGSLLNIVFGKRANSKMGQRPYSNQANFNFCLLVLAAEVMCVDGSVKRSELNYVKAFLLRNFGESQALEMVHTLKEILSQDYDSRAISRQIGTNMDYHSRSQLMQFLFGIASADGRCSYQETQLLESISTNLFLNKGDYQSLYAKFVGPSEDLYSILELQRNATDVEVKKSYHKMAMKYHPDRVSHLGEDIKKGAEEKFQKLNTAYEKIKKERRMK